MRLGPWFEAHIANENLCMQLGGVHGYGSSYRRWASRIRGCVQTATHRVISRCLAPLYSCILGDLTGALLIGDACLVSHYGMTTVAACTVVPGNINCALHCPVWCKPSFCRSGQCKSCASIGVNAWRVGETC